MLPFLKRGDEILTNGFKLVGRNKELSEISAILMRSRANSVLLTGPGGVGCSSLCIGLQSSKKDPDAPFDIISRRLYWLNTDELFRSGDTTEINKSFQKMVNLLKKTPDSVLIITDTKDFVEAARNCGSMHFINSLTSLVKNNESQIILEARDDDLEFVLKCHSDFREHFTLMDLEEPTGNDLLDIVTSISNKYLAEFHDIRISPEAISSAIELSNKYRTLDRAQPDSTVTLLDRALASYRLESHSRPPELANITNEEDLVAAKTEWDKKQVTLRTYYRKLRDSEIALAELEEQIFEETQTAEEASKAAGKITNEFFGGIDSPRLTEMKEQQKQLEAIKENYKIQYEQLTAEINASLILSRDHVLSTFSEISGIPVNKLNQDDTAKLLKIEETLSNRVFSQEDAVKIVANGIKVSRIGVRTVKKPLSFLMLGPSGVGKTEIAKTVAEALLDSESALLRFDMSEYAEKHAVAKLIGAPPGYEGFEAGGILTNAMRKQPNRILLFDEIEKAHPDVFNIFLQILDDGRLTDNIGRTVSFSDSIIIMTSNIGQVYFLEMDYKEARLLAMEELGKTYRNEFLARFNGKHHIIGFKTLDTSTIKRIISRNILKLNNDYGKHGVTVDLSNIDDFCNARDPSSGARGPVGYLETFLEPILADKVLKGEKGHLMLKFDKENGFVAA